MARKKTTTRLPRKKAAARKSARKSPAALPEQVRFHYLKSNAFRVIHVDGAHGGITPKGQIQMALFNERHPIPQQTVHKLAADGSLGELVPAETVTKEGVVREVEAEAVMTLETAKSLVTWLNKKIEQLDELRRATLREAKKTQ